MRNNDAVESLIVERVGQLTLEEKVDLLTGADAWSLRPLPGIGLRRLVMSDGPVGVRGEVWDERDTSANLPSPTALAASWDENLVHRLGELLAAEARRKGVDVLLAPTVNLHRSPYGGRHFECYSEDPLLTARIGTAYVRGVQSGGVAATVKHFIANDSETERMTVDVRMDRRALRELYLAPFDAIVRDGDAWVVMASYNSLDGFTLTESPLLREILADEWGFDGVVVSDWTAARSTEASANAALDVVMPGPQGPWGDALVNAVREGKVSESTIDEKVRRVLRLAARVGALTDGPAATPAPTFDADTQAELLRESAAAGFVLASNENQALPLDRTRLSKLAVLGPNAVKARTQGGGSATVFPSYVVSPVDGISSALGDGVIVTHTAGARATGLLEPISGTTNVRFLGADGKVLGEESRESARFLWLGSFGDDIPADQVSTVEATTTITAETTGEHTVGVAGVGHFTVYVADQAVIEEQVALPEGAEIFEGVVRPPQVTTTVRLESGITSTVRVTYGVEGNPLPALAIGHAEPSRSDAEELAAAVELAREADAAIVVVGTTAEIESEGFDRDSLALPGNQDELVREVAAVNPRTIVVVNSGAPVELPWADDVQAVVLSWFPGQEFGAALADVLFGVREPGGRLPTTWPVRVDDCPVLSTTPVDGVLSYDESIHIGYRAWARAGREPRYAFGHGLGYTEWEIDELAVPEAPDGNGDVTVVAVVRNTGQRAGRTVVQAYLSKSDSAIDRPASWLAGFDTVEAEPDETVRAELTIAARAFEHWDGAANTWATEAGGYDVGVGFSSKALVSKGVLRRG